MSDPDEIVADWKAKTDAATQGPWEAFEQDDAFAIEARAEDDFGFFVVEPPLYQPDAEFIATARTAMPRLLSAVESVLALHKPETRYTASGWEEFSFESRADAAEYGDVQEFKVCHECGQIETHDGGEERCYEYSIWPCATVRAIESALGGGDDAE